MARVHRRCAACLPPLRPRPLSYACATPVDRTSARPTGSGGLVDFSESMDFSESLIVVPLRRASVLRAIPPQQMYHNGAMARPRIHLSNSRRTNRGRIADSTSRGRPSPKMSLCWPDLLPDKVRERSRTAPGGPSAAIHSGSANRAGVNWIHKRSFCGFSARVRPISAAVDVPRMANARSYHRVAIATSSRW